MISLSWLWRPGALSSGWRWRDSDKGGHVGHGLIEEGIAVFDDAYQVAEEVEAQAYDFALSTARQRGNKRAIRQLEAIGPAPHLDARQFGVRVRWASNFGGVTTNETYGAVVRGLLASLLRSSDYAIGDIFRTIRGVTATQSALLPELSTLDLVGTVPRLDVAVVMAQGRQDRVAPGEAAQRYFDSLEAPSKQLVWFESSAHTPHLEEPKKFRELLMQVRAGQPAQTWPAEP